MFAARAPVVHEGHGLCRERSGGMHSSTIFTIVCRCQDPDLTMHPSVFRYTFEKAHLHLKIRI